MYQVLCEHIRSAIYFTFMFSFLYLEQLLFSQPAHPSIFTLQIHWFSVFNSFMMVIFLTGLVSMILMRTLRNDYAKYAREDDDLETLVTNSEYYLSLRTLLVLVCYVEICVLTSVCYVRWSLYL